MMNGLTNLWSGKKPAPKYRCLKEISTQQLEAELLERHKRDEPGKINDLRDVVALRNQLFNEVKKSVEYNVLKDVVRMKKKDYDILVNDGENTTTNGKSNGKMEIGKAKYGK